MDEKAICSLQEFARSARRFVDWMVSHSDVRADALSALRVLTSLYQAGLELPEAWSPEVANAPTADHVHASELDPLRARFKELPIDFYSESLEPTDATNTEFGVGSLCDYLGDIYLDVLRGLRLYEAGRLAEARWEWGFGLQYHWGNHATSAINVLQCCYREGIGNTLQSSPTSSS